MGVPRTRIERVARCQAPVAVDTARRLARLFGSATALQLHHARGVRHAKLTIAYE
jgi:plasmid maintenance system antidote protein VapI